MTDLQKSIKKCRVQGNILFLPAEVLNNYAEVKRALLNAGATYKKNTFVFPTDAKTYIDRLIGGEKINIKKEFQFFATQNDLADELVQLAEIHIDDEILEPSAGQGAIVKAIHRETYDARTVWGYELMPLNRTYLEQIVGFRLLGNDFLKECDTTFDKIIANPPFSKNQDIDHIRKMYDCLKPNGRLVSISSIHWQQTNHKRQKETEFKNWLKRLDAKIIPIDAGRFSESGTNVATCIIVIDK